MRIKKQYIKYLLCLAPFLLSAIVYVQLNASFANILLFLKMIAFIYILCEHLRPMSLTKLDFSFAIYFFIWLFSIIINGESVIDYFKEAVVILSFVFLIENAFDNASDKYLIQAFEHIFFGELVVNLICLIVYPDGLWKTYSIYGQEAIYSFLGLDNQVTPLLIVAELILLVRVLYDGKRITRFSALYGIVLAANLFFMMSATGVIGCLIIPVVLWLGVKYRKQINIKMILGVVIAIFLVVVVFRLQNIFAFIIEGVFHKDLSLSNRVGIWDRAIAEFRKKPLLGSGCGTLAATVGDRNAHDFYLQILLQSGVIGFLAYVNVFRVALSKCWKTRYSDASLIVAATLCGYLICCISEVYSQSWLSIILAIAYNVIIISQKKIS